MSEILYNSDIVTLSFDKENQLVEMLWKRNTDSEEYRKMFGKMIEFSENNKIRLVLSDMRQQGLVVTEDVQWMNKEVLKRAVEHKIDKIALIIADTIFSSVYSDVIKKKLEHSPIQVQVFMDITSGRAWLLNN